MSDCTTCARASWRRTAAGRLHPSGDGFCKWEMPEIVVPACRYYLSGRAPQMVPKPNGGHINRREPHKASDCSCYLPIGTTPAAPVELVKLNTILFLLYAGTSVDGAGPGEFWGWTVDMDEARRHWDKCRADPHSVGRVVAIQGSQKLEFVWKEDWERLGSSGKLWSRPRP